MHKLVELLLAVYKNVSLTKFREILNDYGEEKIDEFIPEIFSGEYITLLDLIILPRNINNEYVFTPDLYHKFGKNIYQATRTTLLNFAIQVEQVDLLEFIISKGGHITAHTLDILLTVNNIDIANLILQNVDINLVSEEYIVILLENHEFDRLKQLQIRGINFNNYPMLINIIDYDYEVADYLLHAGYDVRGENVEVPVAIEDNKLIDLLNAFGANVFLEPLKVSPMRNSEYVYEESWGTVFRLQDGEYICIGNTYDRRTVEPLSNEGRALAERYGIPIEPII